MIESKQRRFSRDFIPEEAEPQSRIPLEDRVTAKKGQEISRELREAVAEFYRDNHRDNPVRLDHIAEIRVDVDGLDRSLRRHRENRIPALLDGSPLGDPPPGRDPLADLVRRLNAGELNESTTVDVLCFFDEWFLGYLPEAGKKVLFFVTREYRQRVDDAEGDAQANDRANDRDGDRANDQDGEEAGNP